MNAYEEQMNYFRECAEQYRFFSQVIFKELTEETIDTLAKTDFPTDTGNENLDAGYTMINRYFGFSATNRRTQLAVEYARIFLGAGIYSKGETTAVPYESAFTSEEHLMMQESRDDVVARYLRDGFVVNPTLHEPEDHLAFEFEYLSTMNTRAAELLEQGDGAALRENRDRQISFIEDHLLNWIPRLREVAQEYAKLSFYIGMLLVFEGTLQQSLDFLRDTDFMAKVG